MKETKTEIAYHNALAGDPEKANPEALAADVIGVLNTVDVPIIVIGRDAKVIRFNRAATDELGVTQSDVGRHVRNMQALVGFPNIEQMCVRVMFDGIPSRHDVRHGDRWFLLHLALHAGTENQTRGVVLTFTNVTAFRASVAQAVYEREYTKTILNAVIDPLVVLDANLQIQTANRAFYEWFGLSREKVQGILLSSLGDNAWRTADLWSAIKETLADSRPFQTVEFERDFPKIGRRTVLIDARRMMRDKNALILVGFRDSTERKRTELALRESENRVRAIFESMDEGHCVIEMVFDDKKKPTDYRFIEVSPAFEKQTGIHNAQGRLMREIAPDHEQHWFDIYGRIALTGEPHRFESPAAALHRHYRVYAFRVDAPELHRVGIVFDDITAHKELERENALLLVQKKTFR